jgi:hypothetical protein
MNVVVVVVVNICFSFVIGELLASELFGPRFVVFDCCSATAYSSNDPG